MPAQHRQAALGERERFAEREQPDLMLRGREVVPALAEIARGLEEDRRAAPRWPRVAATMGNQGVRHAAAQRRAAGRLQRRVEDVLVEHVHEL